MGMVIVCMVHRYLMLRPHMSLQFLPIKNMGFMIKDIIDSRSQEQIAILQGIPNRLFLLHNLPMMVGIVNTMLQILLTILTEDIILSMIEIPVESIQRICTTLQEFIRMEDQGIHPDLWARHQVGLIYILPKVVTVGTNHLQLVALISGAVPTRACLEGMDKDNIIKEETGATNNTMIRKETTVISKETINKEVTRGSISPGETKVSTYGIINREETTVTINKIISRETINSLH